MSNEFKLDEIDSDFEQELKYKYTDKAVCPYCLEEQKDSDEGDYYRHSLENLIDGVQTECDFCNKDFWLQADVAVKYVSNKEN